VRSQEIARRYAEALYEVAVDADALEAVQGDLAEITQGLGENEEVQRFLSHPLVPRDAKSALLTAAFPDLTEWVGRFVDVLIRHQRERYIDLIWEQFVALRNAREGRLPVRIDSARPLSEQDRQRVQAKLEGAWNRPVVLHEQIDPTLLGGVRIEVNGRVVDGSIRLRLDQLQQQLQE